MNLNNPSHEITNLITLAKSSSDDELYGSIARNVSSVDATFRETKAGEILSVGQKVFSRWENTLYQFLCSPDSADEEIKKEMKSAISTKDISGAGVIAQALVTLFGISSTLAVPVSLLLKRILLEPAADEVCRIWKNRVS
jgi:hypothetical protein